MIKWLLRQISICIIIISIIYIVATNTQAVSQSTKSPFSNEESKTCTISKRFPKEVYRWCDLIEKYANKNNLDPNLVASVILIESAGIPNVISQSGAVGLMQVMPSDGKTSSFICTNGPCFANRPKTNELLDPEFNIKYGTRMLAQLINQKGGIREGLMAYGPYDQKGYYANLVLETWKKYTNP